HPKPFFRSGRGWYVQLGKQQLKLCDGPQNSQTEAEAWQRYHAIMTERAAAPAIPPPAADSSGLAVAEVLDKYLDWCRLHRAAKTHGWYRDHLQSFLDHLKEIGRLPAEQLKPFHVVEWADAHPDWSTTTRRGAIVAVQRTYNWAEEMGYI